MVIYYFYILSWMLDVRCSMFITLWFALWLKPAVDKIHQVVPSLLT
jgi:hypothetical protein